MSSSIRGAVLTLRVIMILSDGAVIIIVIIKKKTQRT